MLCLNHLTRTFIWTLVGCQACVVRGFASAEECDEMRGSMAGLIADWDPSSTAVFRTDDKQVGEQGAATSGFF